LIHIDIDGTSSTDLHAHWDHYNPSFPVLLHGAAIFSTYGSGAIPFSAILDPEGVLRFSGEGYAPEQMHSVIQQYMTLTTPHLSILSVEVLGDGNADGRPDAGETVALSVSLANYFAGLPASSLEITLTSSDPTLTIIDASAALPSGLGAGEQATLDLAFQFSVHEDALPHWSELLFHIESAYAGGNHSQDILYAQRIARPLLLLIDADGSESNEIFAVAALDSLGRDFDIWNLEAMASPSAVDLGYYSQLIWLGGRREMDITSEEAAALSAVASENRLILISSQYAGNHPNNADLLATTFGVAIANPSAGTLYQTAPPANDPWFSDMEFLLTGSSAANNTIDPDDLDLSPGAQLLAQWTQGALAPAAAYHATPHCNAIYCGFPIEAMRTHAALPQTVKLSEFLERVFLFHADNQPQDELMAIDDLSVQVLNGRVRLQWSLIEGASLYRIEASDLAFSGFQEIGTTASPSFEVSAVAASRSFYRVTALSR
jgi:hypothetical protein